MNLFKVSWLDSANMPSHIHLTSDGKDTLCGNHTEYLANRKLVRSPRTRGGRSNFCKRCFKVGSKSLPWMDGLEELPQTQPPYTSHAEWPANVHTNVNGGHTSTDTHHSREAAEAVCSLLHKNGFGGNRLYFPIRTWVTP